MKYLKYLFVMLIVLSIALVSCKKDSTTGPAGGSIVGTWNIVGGNFGWFLTTNSNQVATNMFAVTGQVSITGAVNITFNFMIMDDSTNPPSFFISDITNENQNAFLLLDGATGQGMLITNTGQTFLGNVTFTYNAGVLTITQATIQDVASNATVTVSGSLTYQLTNIPANTPTQIQFPEGVDGDDEFGLTTVTFNNDGTAVVTSVDEDGTETENWTYATEGTQLTVNDGFGETMVFEYSISGNNMTWTTTDFEDMCEGYASQAECFADWELFFNLTPGSLTNISLNVELMFSRAAAKQGLNIGKTYDLMNPAKRVVDYRDKINDLRKNL